MRAVAGGGARRGRGRGSGWPARRRGRRRAPPGRRGRRRAPPGRRGRCCPRVGGSWVTSRVVDHRRCGKRYRAAWTCWRHSGGRSRRAASPSRRSRVGPAWTMGSSRGWCGASVPRACRRWSGWRRPWGCGWSCGRRPDGAGLAVASLLAWAVGGVRQVPACVGELLALPGGGYRGGLVGPPGWCPRTIDYPTTPHGRG